MPIYRCTALIEPTLLPSPSLPLTAHGRWRCLYHRVGLLIWNIAGCTIEKFRNANYLCLYNISRRYVVYVRTYTRVHTKRGRERERERGGGGEHAGNMQFFDVGRFSTLPLSLGPLPSVRLHTRAKSYYRGRISLTSFISRKNRRAHKRNVALVTSREIL